MPWQRGGDTGATYPPLMQTAGFADAEEWTVNEVAGFVWRCSLLSAAHMTDYVVDIGTVQLLGGPRWQLLIRQCVRAGLLTKVRGAKAWKLIDDPDFIHLRSREQVLRDRQRDKDRRNKDLVMAVLARDGDECRYCALTVNPRDHRGARGREFDSRDQHRATTVETYVVACKGCNRRRWDIPTTEADERWPLLVAPVDPFYHPETAAQLEAHFGRQFRSARLGIQPDTARARPASQSGTARSLEQKASEADRDLQDGTAAKIARPDLGMGATPPARPGIQPDTARHTGDPKGDRCDSRATRTVSTRAPNPGKTPGSGGGTRDGTGSGSGRVGPGLDGPGRPVEVPGRPRGRRAGRSR